MHKYLSTWQSEPCWVPQYQCYQPPPLYLGQCHQYRSHLSILQPKIIDFMIKEGIGLIITCLLFFSLQLGFQRKKQWWQFTMKWWFNIHNWIHSYLDGHSLSLLLAGEPVPRVGSLTVHIPKINATNVLMY